MKRSEVLKYTMPLSGLTELNVHDIYKRELLKWRLSKSDEVLFEGEPIDKWDLQLKLFALDINIKNAGGKFKYCNTIKGIALTKEMFIQEQRKRYERVKTFTHGDLNYTVINARIGLYLDQLNNEMQNPHFEFVNKFDDVPESDVYKYFYDKLVTTRMLTEIEFHQYLKVAFEKEGKLKKKLVLKNSKGITNERKIFNKYSKDIAGRSSKELNKYIGLLGDYFQGHDNKVTLYSNFGR